MEQALITARELLKDVTPLRRDCGRVCGARCCRPLEGEDTGMLLFPGEEEAYRQKEGWEIRPLNEGQLLVCAGSCARQERPLSCRLFPLLPLPAADGGVRPVMDARARAVCPLVRHGLIGLDPAFVAAVKAAGEALMRSETQAAFLRRLEREQQEWKQIADYLMGRSSHV